jgi:hypothetical protein
VVRTCRLRPRGEHIDAVELCVVAAAVLAVTADAVIATQHIPEIVAILVTAMARLHV